MSTCKMTARVTQEDCTGRRAVVLHRRFTRELSACVQALRQKSPWTQSFSSLLAGAVVAAITVTSQSVSPSARGDVRGGRMHSEQCGKPTT